MDVYILNKNASLALNYTQIPCLSCGFSISQIPNLGICRVVKARKCRAISAVLKSEPGETVIDKGLIEDEFGFKPSFDEHLKVMQSVIVKRKKRNLTPMRNDIPGMPSDQKSAVTGVKFGVKEIHNSITMNRSKVGSSGNGPVLVRSTESETNAKNKINEVGNMKSERWVKDQSKNVRVQSSKEMANVVEKTGRSMPMNEGFRHDENVRRASVSLKKYNLNWQTLVREPCSKNLPIQGMYDRNHDQVDKTFSAKNIVVKNGYTNSSGTYAEKVDSKNLDIERAAFNNFDVFNRMDKPRVTRMEMEERIQKLAYRLNCADTNIPEWMFSNMMRSAEIRFSDHSIVRIIQLLGKLGNWRRALQVIDWCQMRERFKSYKPRYIYTATLDVLGKARRPKEALNLFHVMQQQMSSYPDRLAYRSISATLGQSGHVKELFDLIDCMRSLPTQKFDTGLFENWDPRLEPDLVVYNAVLNACAQRKQWEGANWVLQQLKEQGLQPSCTTYGLVMEVMCACGKYNLVHEFFRKVQKSSTPNALMYKVVVNTLWREGKPDEAILAVRDMERLGIVGSASLYYDFARCLCSAGRCREALMQVEKICKVANKPLVVTYTGLIQACLESKNIHDGAYIFSQMHTFCNPNLATYNVMLKGYVEHGMFEEAKQLFHDISKDENHISSISDYKERVLPDVFTFNSMLDICFAEKRWEDFSFFYTKMLHHGYPFNSKRHLQMILYASQAGKEELLETTWNHLTQTNQILPVPLILERFCIKLGKGDYSAAISCITTTPGANLLPQSNKAWLNLFKTNAQRLRKETFSGLIQEVSNVLGESDLPDPILQNLISSCRDFFSIINFTESIKTISAGTDMKF